MSDHRKPVAVRVSAHARERFVERFRDIPRYRVTGLIYAEVQQALDEHRMSAKLPRWCEWAGYDNGRHTRRRFVWNEEKTRCYPLVRDHNRDADRADEFGVRWVVATTLVALTPEQLDEQKRLRQVDRESVGNRKQRYGTLVFGGRQGSGRKVR